MQRRGFVLPCPISSTDQPNPNPHHHRPLWTTLLLITVLQHAASKFAFLKNDVGSRELANR